MSVPRTNQDGSSRLFALLRGELWRARAAYWREAAPLAIGGAGLVACLAGLLIHLIPPASVRSGETLALIFRVASILPFLLALLWPFRRLPGLRRFLIEVERRAETKQLLETAADAAEGRLEGKGYSPDLMRHLLESAKRMAARGLPKPEPAQWRRRLQPAAILLPLLALALLFRVTPEGIRPLSLLLDPADLEHYAENAYLNLLPGSMELLAGSSLRLELRERNLPWRFPGELKLELDETGDLYRSVDLKRDGESWVYEIPAVYQGFTYRAERGRADTEVYRVTVFHEPVLDSLRLLAHPPAYTGLPSRRIDLRSGELSVPVGTRIKVDGYCSNDLTRAWLVSVDDEAQTDSLNLAVEGRAFAGEILAREDRRFAVRMRDSRGTEVLTPYLLSLRTVPDQAPRVEILSPGPAEDMNRDLLVTLDVTATDDYGVAAMLVRACKHGETDTLDIPLPLEGEISSRVALKHLWDLGMFELFPGDVVEYFVEARDARPGDPGVGRSRVHRLRVPSIAEIFAEIEAEDEIRTDVMSEMLEQGREMQEELHRLEQELRADQDVDWEKEEELREALAKQEEMAERMEELTRSLSERTEALGENELLSEEMAEKLDRIEELMEELADTEAGELLRRFQEMVDEMDPETLPEELRDLRMEQEEVLEQLERTAAMLEQMKREQQMDALMRQIDEMLERQEQLRAETEERQEDPAESDNVDDESETGEESDAEEREDEGEESDPSEESGETESVDAETEEDESGLSDEELAERQEQLAKEAEELAEKMKEMAEELAEKFPEEAKKMEESAQPESENNPTQPMKDAAEKMQDESSEAGESQQEASARLLKLYWQMIQSQGSMQNSVDAEALEALGEVTRQTLELSLREENLHLEMERTFQTSRDANRTRRSARGQMNLYMSLDRVRENLIEAAKKTMAVSPQAMQHSRSALTAMENSVAELESGRAAWGLREAGSSIAYLNKTVIELLHGIQSSGGGGGGMSSPSQSMQRMLQQQEQLNRDSREQGQMGPGGLSQEQRARMGRLKAEQEAIREGIEEMNGQEGVLGSLDQIIEDMKEVEKDFEAGRINDETLRRQDKIFEKLLDAQRSVHRRDFKQKRRSDTADELAPLWPDDEEQDDPLARLRDEIRRGLGDAAPSEYEELIQEYYRSLLDNREEVTP
ncbi:MAG: DUF4175 family protein [bacterium]|nr:DUF4175 family protein [bacterium]